MWKIIIVVLISISVLLISILGCSSKISDEEWQKKYNNYSGNSSSNMSTQSEQCQESDNSKSQISDDNIGIEKDENIDELQYVIDGAIKNDKNINIAKLDRTDIENKIIAIAGLYKILKEKYETMTYLVQSCRPSSKSDIENINKMAKELREFANNKYVPIMQLFSKYISFYIDKYGANELANLAMENNFYDLISK